MRRKSIDPFRRDVTPRKVFIKGGGIAPSQSMGGPTYYVDNAGSDAAAGTSIATPWQTIAKVNAATLPLRAVVLFKGGQTFSGTITAPRDGLTFGSYGTGRATISSGAAGGFIAVSKTGTTVKDLIFTGNGIATNTAYGITIENASAATIAGPTITNCSVSAYGWNGINVQGTNGTSGFRGVTIQDCTVTDCTGKGPNREGRAGIYVACLPAYGALTYGFSNSNVTISGCTVSGCTGTAGLGGHTGSGILVGEVDTALITGCVSTNNGANSTSPAGPVGIWCFDSRNVTFHACESYSNKTGLGTADGGGFDMDGGCVNCTVQYCYSHDNHGAGFLVYSYDDDTLFQDSGNTVRYCVSQNDGTQNPTEKGGIQIGNDSTRGMLALSIYNNTVYNSTVSTRRVLHIQSGTMTGKIANNIFYSANDTLMIYAPSGGSSLTLRNNLYYNSGTLSIRWGGTTYSSYATWRTAASQEGAPGADTGLTANPLLTSPGTGGTLGGVLSGLTAYKLQAGSPAIDAGAFLVDVFAIKPGGRDFYGNFAPNGMGYEVGAHEFT